ncbi:hypothetical protein F4777DRAFT_358263 [Nemania sp. FL0916]|nr:hypothetical protein F4777DRAFT_358263 [Nemania sp. FL0916]
MHSLDPHRGRPLISLSPQAWQYAGAACIAPCGGLLVAGLLSAGFFPPPPPSWDAAQTAQYYRDHSQRIRVGATLIMAASLFYVPYTMVVSVRLRRIPNLHPVVAWIQVATGATSTYTLMLTGILLATAAFRPDRPAELTQMLNDLFWLVWAAAWPTFVVQFLAFGFAAMGEFPRALAVFSVYMSVIALVADLSTHYFHTGPLAWNGVVGFWLPGLSWVVMMGLELVCLVRVIRMDEWSQDGVADVSPENVENDQVKA